MKKILIFTGGSISLSLGIIGIFLPVLPTTPFLLLSATCYLKSSERLYNWLINHKILGLYVKNYIEHKAITIKAKVVSISTLWIVISATVIFFTDSLHLRLFLMVVAIGVTIHLLRMNTLKN